MKIKITGAAYTHPGKVRDINEDSVLIHIRPENQGKPLGFLAVADGIGGHKAGEVASNLAIKTIFNSLAWFLTESSDEETVPITDLIKPSDDSLQDTPMERRLRRAIEQANRIIYNYAQENTEEAGNLGSTITCALIHNRNLTVAHVGDSRAYLLREGVLRQLTEDHSFVGQLIRGGHLPEEAYYEHPRRNIITRALGQAPEVQVDLISMDLLPGDKIMVCSDGLWEMVRDEHILPILNSKADPQRIVESLVNKAIENGGADNIGAAICEITGRL